MKKTTKRKFYVCGVDWQEELGNTSIVFYKSKAALKRSRTCWISCGIVEVTMTGKWAVKQDLGRGILQPIGKNIVKGYKSNEN